jgi:hypothetical protein
MQLGTEMKRSGRKRKMTRRTSTGAVARAKPVDWGAIAAENPDRRELPAALRLSEKAGTALGRLNITGRISDNQHEAARRYAVVVGAFLRMSGAPLGTSGNGRAYDCMGAYPCENEPCSCQMQENAYRSANFALMSRAGYRGYVAVYGIAINDRPCPDDQLPTLACGLDALAEHFGLTNHQKKRTH